RRPRSAGMIPRLPAGLLAAVIALCAAAVAAGAPQDTAPPTASPGAARDLDQLMQLLAARRHGHVTFTEVQHLAMLERPLESSGELFYDAPDRLEKRTLKPRPEGLVLAHGVLTATRDHRTRTLELAAYPQVAPLIESIRATLAGDRTTLERIFSVRFDGDLAHWTLILAPRDAAAARTVRQVRIAGERAALQSVEIVQPDGDRSLLSLGPDLSR
ncbi:MAG: LolA-related protein, partial [Steroidobacteraceae bacterium]